MNIVILALMCIVCSVSGFVAGAVIRGGNNEDEIRIISLQLDKELRRNAELTERLSSRMGG